MTAEILDRKSTYTTGSSMVAKTSNVPVQNAAFTPFVSVKAILNLIVFRPAEPVCQERLDDAELTKLSMAYSEPSLTEGWENEDDEKWNSFLNA